MRANILFNNAKAGRTRWRILLLITLLPFVGTDSVFSQTNLLLNGGFEDINTCTEYKSECGVEGWFYLKDVKAQMLLNENNISLVGANSFGLFYNWVGYKDFTPLIGALLPCGLQKGKRYTFKGLISAKLNNKLLLQAGVCLGEKFYVPGRPFAKDLRPDSIVSMSRVPNTNFFSFEYSFIADGPVRYLTFGTYTKEDTTGAKKKLYGTQTISLVLDNFQLIPGDPKETLCSSWAGHKEKIYDYNYRHKEMDYSLYGKGAVDLDFDFEDPRTLTQVKEPPVPAKSDTLKLGDVFFDFNQASLKPAALKVLKAYFIDNGKGNFFDSIIVNGHTDSVGSDSRNLALSQQRSESILKWLVINNIISQELIQIRPFGKSKPVAPNRTAEGRALNRRVEMIVFRRGR